MLILFEYLTLWMHPNVAELTHHTPLIEILIFVCLAAILIPAHHRLEHWLLEKLTHSKHRLEQGQINIHRQKLKLKKPSD